MKADDIASAVKGATKDWAKQRKKEERGRSTVTRQDMYVSCRVYFSEVARDILPDAYAHASGDGKYSVSKRQLYYACRGEFQNRTGRELGYQYFANTLLVQYMNRNVRKTKHWKITADPRGTLTIPNAGHKVQVPCGTIEIDNHLRKESQSTDPFGFNPRIDIEWPSYTANQRYQGVLYIEKEGFAPILKEAKIAERFDLAILSCKGQSVVAARKYIDEVCGGRNVPLFVVHDFDKAGFEIAERLTETSDWAWLQDRVTYEFQYPINVIDLGLRLEDAERYELESESCKRAAPSADITDDERKFLKSGRRVELNAFTSPDFVEWLENKLSQRLPDRLVPSDDVLADAYRRALAVAEVNTAIEQVSSRAVENAKQAEVPSDLRDELAESMEDEDQPWDQALYKLAKDRIEDQGSDDKAS